MDLTSVLKQLREELDAARVRIVALERKQVAQKRTDYVIADAVRVDDPKPRRGLLIVINAVTLGTAPR